MVRCGQDAFVRTASYVRLSIFRDGLQSPIPRGEAASRAWCCLLLLLGGSSVPALRMGEAVHVRRALRVCSLCSAAVTTRFANHTYFASHNASHSSDLIDGECKS